MSAPAVIPVRRRRPEDVPPLIEMLQAVHEQEGYPVRAAAVSAQWLASDAELQGWVALDGERVVGHVALHPADGAALPGWQAATRCDADGLAVVSRLFTDRSVPGAGSTLLAHAADAARAAGRRAVLQVDPEAAAVRFYLRRGWREVGTVRQQWGHRTVDAVLMVAPGSCLTPAGVPGRPPR